MMMRPKCMIDTRSPVNRRPPCLRSGSLAHVVTRALPGHCRVHRRAAQSTRISCSADNLHAARQRAATCAAAFVAALLTVRCCFLRA